MMLALTIRNKKLKVNKQYTHTGKQFHPAVVME